MAKSKSYNKSTIWEDYTASMTPESIVDNIRNPAVFQVGLSDYINGILHGKGSVIEVGCESGVTSFLLDCEKRCFFDLNGSIISKVKKAHSIVQKERTQDSFIVGDMFKMPFENESFDLSFNAGVLEHFSNAEVSNALKEMSRITGGE